MGNPPVLRLSNLSNNISCKCNLSNSPTGKLDLPPMVSKGKDKDKANEETVLLGIETGQLRARRMGILNPAVSP